MSTFAWPSFLVVRDFRFYPEAAVLMHNGDLGESGQVIDLLKDRWVAEINVTPYGSGLQGQARDAAAFLARLRSGVNKVFVHNFAQPIPRGSLRGAPTAQAAAQGAGTIVINCMEEESLEAFDCVGVGGQIFMVAQKCVAASGVLTVPLVNRVRSAISPGSAVVWQRPTIEMRLLGNPAMLFDPRLCELPSLQFVEAIFP